MKASGMIALLLSSILAMGGPAHAQYVYRFKPVTIAGGGSGSESGVSIRYNTPFAPTIGANVDMPLTVTGSAAGMTFARASSYSMDGLTVDLSTGRVTGTPAGTDGQTYSFQVQGTRGDGSTVLSNVVSGTIRQPLIIQTMPNNVSISGGAAFPTNPSEVTAVTVGGYQSGVTFDMTGEPTWLELAPTAQGQAQIRVRSGHQMADFTGNVQIVARDSEGRQSAPRTFHMQVDVADDPVSITFAYPSPQTFEVNTNKTFELTKTGTSGTTRYVAAPGAQMCGLQVDQNDGRIHGNIPNSLANGTSCVLQVEARAGSTTGTVLATSNQITGTVSNSGGSGSTGPTVSGPWSYSGPSSTPFPNQTFTASGAQSPYSWTVSNLPDWADYSTPTADTMVIRKRTSSTLAIGTSNVTIVARDANGVVMQDGSRNFALTIYDGGSGPAIALDGSSGMKLTKGQYYSFNLSSSGTDSNTRYYSAPTSNHCGLTVNETQGHVTGTVTTSIPEGENCVFIVEARDGSSTGPIIATSSAVTGQAYSIPNLTGPSNYSGPLANGFPDQVFTVTSGGRDSLTWEVTGLPAWAEKVEAPDRRSITIRKHPTSTVTTHSGNITVQARDDDGRTSGTLYFNVTIW